MSTGSICTRSVVMADPEETVRDATDLMRKHNVGTVVVVDRMLRPVGILTDRDIALRCVALGKLSEATHIREVMSTPVRTVSETTPIEETVYTMRSLGVRRLPVTDARSKLVGIVSLDDVVDLIAGEVTEIGSLLRKETPVLL
jgi:CBS domain-containing protein